VWLPLRTRGADRAPVRAGGQCALLGPLLDRAGAAGGDLWLVDDRRSGVRAEYPRVGDGERAALDLVGRQLLRPGALAEIADGPRHAHQRELIRVLDHGHDEAPVERHGDAAV